MKGIYTNHKGLNAETLIRELQSKKFMFFGGPAYKHIFSNESPLAGYKLTPYAAEGFNPMLGLLGFSKASNIEIRLEKA